MCDEAEYEPAFANTMISPIFNSGSAILFENISREYVEQP
jgi:hypothetical protein